MKTQYWMHTFQWVTGSHQVQVEVDKQRVEQKRQLTLWHEYPVHISHNYIYTARHTHKRSYINIHTPENSSYHR